MAKEVPYNLLARYFSGNGNEQENLQVMQWRNADRANEILFTEYERMWKNARSAEKPFFPNVDDALQTIDRKLGQEQSKITVSWLYYAQRIAAVFLIAAGLWSAYLLLHRKPEREPALVVTTLQGEKREVLLPDGSRIWLNAASKLTYAASFKGKERRVMLEGEAYFEVAKDASHPFVIDAGNSLTTVLGTAFNLRARKEEGSVVVTVTEGKVALAGKDPSLKEPVKLLKGDKGILDIRHKHLVRLENEDPNFLAWKTGKLVFRNTPLNVVVAKLTDFYGKRIEVKDPNKAEVPFTSTFDHQSLQNVITIMEMSLGLKADSVDHVIELK